MTEKQNAGQGAHRHPQPCPRCGRPTVTLKEELYTARGPIVITSIACQHCLAAGEEEWFWEVARYNKYMRE